MARKLPTARKGYEPGLGQPDPQDPAFDGPPQRARVTHYADGGRGGPVCGIRPTPTEASAYDPTDPSCPECADWLTKTREHTARKHGATIAANEAMTKAADAVARKSAAPPAPKSPPQNPSPPAGDAPKA